MKINAWSKGTLTVFSDNNAWLNWGPGCAKFFIDADDALAFAARNGITSLTLADGGD